jgi:hypothetical protein
MSVQASTITNTITTNRESGWNDLYKLSGAAALVLLVYSLATMVILVVIGGQPESAQEGFRMLQENRVAGLLRLDLHTVLVMPLYYVLFLALYSALQKTHAAYVTLAALLGVAGVTLFLATPSVFSWLALSDKFAATTTDVQREQLLAAGEAILASDMWHGSGAIMSGLLEQTAMLSLSILMLRSNAFSKWTTWVGVVMHGLDLLHILVAFFIPTGGVMLMWVAGPLYLAWFPLLARDFFKLGQSNG